MNHSIGKGLRWTTAIMFALAMAVIPGSAFAAQETKWDSYRQNQLLCGANRVGCGKVSAVVNVTAVKGARFAGWSRQSQIEMLPFTVGGRYHGTDQWPPTYVICVELRIVMQARSQIVSTAPFGSVPDALDGHSVVQNTVGSVASLRGSKCRKLKAVIGASSGSVTIRPEVSALTTGGARIEKVTIKAKTRIYISARAYYTSPWASDTINFG